MAHTRKNSRINSNRDLLNMLLITSDPLIDSFREKPLKNARSIPPEILTFLVEPDLTASTSQRSNEDDNVLSLEYSETSDNESD